MLLKYTGTHARVAVPLPAGGEAQVDRGGTVEIPDDHARLLLAQGTWEAAAAADAAVADKTSAKAAKAAAPSTTEAGES